MGLALVGQDVEAAFYAREVARHGAPVLVLGCAQGRIAFSLAARGHRVVGADPSEAMVKAAEELRLESLPDGERLHFVAADLRSLRLSERFPTVVAPQNALAWMGSLDDLGALLATVRHHLLPKGTFLFDVVNRGEVERAEERGGWRGQPHPEMAGGPVVPFLEPPRPLFSPHLRERRRAPGQRGERSIRRLRLRHFEAHELEGALREAGFEVEERYGSFGGKPFEPSDPVQIVVARGAE